MWYFAFRYPPTPVIAATEAAAMADMVVQCLLRRSRLARLVRVQEADDGGTKTTERWREEGKVSVVRSAESRDGKCRGTSWEYD